LLLQPLVLVPHLVEHLSDASEWINLTYIFNLTTQILWDDLCDFSCLILWILIIHYLSSISQCVIHSQLLLQVSNLFLVSLNL
jgi:hypothetical protein